MFESITLFTSTLDFCVSASCIGPSVVGGLEFDPPTISDESSSVRDNSPNIVVVVVDTDNSSLSTGPLKFSDIESELKTGIVVVVVDASFRQFVFFLNFPTLLFEPNASVVIILALYLAPSGTPDIVVIDLEEPAGIL